MRALNHQCEFLNDEKNDGFSLSYQQLDYVYFNIVDDISTEVYTMITVD